MINTVTVTNEAGNVLVMDLRDPDASGFLVHDISGLGPGSTEIRQSDLASLPGSIFTNSRKPARNIVFNLKLLWASTVEECRHLAELYFPLGRKISMRFDGNDRLSTIDGYVESNEPVIFSTKSDCGIDCQISVICVDPTFKALRYKNLFSEGLEGGFYFTFPRPSDDFPNVTDLDDSYEDPEKYRLAMSTLVTDRSDILLDYQGTAETGCEFQIRLNQAAQRVKVISDRTGAMVYVELPEESKLLPGDFLNISTIQGERGVTICRDGVEENGLKYLSSDSDFDGVMLTKGYNHFRVICDYMEATYGTDVNIKYREAYWSV